MPSPIAAAWLPTRPSPMIRCSWTKMSWAVLSVVFIKASRLPQTIMVRTMCDNPATAGPGPDHLRTCVLRLSRYLGRSRYCYPPAPRCCTLHWLPARHNAPRLGKAHRRQWHHNARVSGRTSNCNRGAKIRCNDHDMARVPPAQSPSVNVPRTSLLNSIKPGAPREEARPDYRRHRCKAASDLGLRTTCISADGVVDAVAVGRRPHDRARLFCFTDPALRNLYESRRTLRFPPTRLLRPGRGIPAPGPPSNADETDGTDRLALWARPAR